MWARLKDDVTAWFNGQPISVELWAALGHTVRASKAARAYKMAVKKSVYEDYVLEMTAWLAEYIINIHQVPCAFWYKAPLAEPRRRKCAEDKYGSRPNVEQVMVKYTTKWMRDSFRYLFVYRMIQAGFNIHGDKSPVAYVYQAGLVHSGLMKLWAEAHKQGIDPWANIKHLVVSAALPSQVGDIYPFSKREYIDYLVKLWSDDLVPDVLPEELTEQVTT